MRSSRSVIIRPISVAGPEPEEPGYEQAHAYPQRDPSEKSNQFHFKTPNQRPLRLCRAKGLAAVYDGLRYPCQYQKGPGPKTEAQEGEDRL